jgi:hypothetical protein
VLTRTPRRTAACPIFFDPLDDDDVPFKFDLGLAGPAPPVTIPAIVVESPSLDLGDKRLGAPSSRSRQRRNSFKDLLATRKPAPSSIAHQHGGCNGKKADSRLLQVPPLSYRGHSCIGRAYHHNHLSSPFGLISCLSPSRLVLFWGPGPRLMMVTI